MAEASKFTNGSIQASTLVAGVQTSVTLSMVNQYQLNSSCVFIIYYPTQMGIKTLNCSLPTGANCSILS